MTLQDQVISLESAKRFEELGVKQESLFYWVSRGHDYKLEQGYPGTADNPHVIAAFTSSELLAKLPVCIQNKWLTIRPMLPEGICDVGYMMDEGWLNSFTGEALPDALAKLLIHLLEQGLIKIYGTK